MQPKPCKNEISIISTHSIPIRLDRLIRANYPDITQGILEKLLRKKTILLNDNPTKANHRVQLNDVVKILIAPDKFVHKSADAFKANDKNTTHYSNSNYVLQAKTLGWCSDLISAVIYSNNYCIAINKPKNLPSQGGNKITFSVDHTLHIINQIAKNYAHNEHINAMQGLSKNDKKKYQFILDFIHIQQQNSFNNMHLTLKLVHRLDVDTTGVMIIAKTTDAAIFLGHAFKQRNICKYYAALICIENLPREHILLRAMSANKSLTISSDKEITDLLPVKLSSDGLYMMCIFGLVSGKKHQIRRHCATIGSPILFDPLYSTNECTKDNKVRLTWCKSQTQQSRLKLSAQAAVDQLDQRILALRQNNYTKLESSKPSIMLHSLVSYIPQNWVYQRFIESSRSISSLNAHRLDIFNINVNHVLESAPEFNSKYDRVEAPLSPLYAFYFNSHITESSKQSSPYKKKSST